VALRTAIKHFFKLSAAGLKVGTLILVSEFIGLDETYSREGPGAILTCSFPNRRQVSRRWR
jgi:hypothetical protein